MYLNFTVACPKEDEIYNLHTVKYGKGETFYGRHTALNTHYSESEMNDRSSEIKKHINQRNKKQKALFNPIALRMAKTP